LESTAIVMPEAEPARFLGFDAYLARLRAVYVIPRQFVVYAHGMTPAAQVFCANLAPLDGKHSFS